MPNFDTRPFFVSVLPHLVFLMEFDGPFYVKAYMAILALRGIYCAVWFVNSIMTIINLAKEEKPIDYSEPVFPLVVMCVLFLFYRVTNQGKSWPSRITWISNSLAACLEIIELVAVPSGTIAIKVAVSLVSIFVAFKADRALSASTEPKEVEPLVTAA